MRKIGYHGLKKDDIKIIYSHSPLIIKKINLETGECPTNLELNNGFNLEEFRGSSSPIDFPLYEWNENRYTQSLGKLSVIHEVIYNNGTRYYFHRFVWFDKDFRIKKVSKLFYFDHKGVEFCAGMCWSHDMKNLVLSCGIEDHEAYIYIIEIRKIEQMLYNL